MYLCITLIQLNVRDETSRCNVVFNEKKKELDVCIRDVFCTAPETVELLHYNAKTHLI